MKQLSQPKVLRPDFLILQPPMAEMERSFIIERIKAGFRKPGAKKPGPKIVGKGCRTTQWKRPKEALKNSPTN